MIYGMIYYCIDIHVCVHGYDDHIATDNEVNYNEPMCGDHDTNDDDGRVVCRSESSTTTSM